MRFYCLCLLVIPLAVLPRVAASKDPKREAKKAVKPGLRVDTSLDSLPPKTVDDAQSLTRRFSSYGSAVYQRARRLSRSSDISDDQETCQGNEDDTPSNKISPRSSASQFGFFKANPLFADAFASATKKGNTGILAAKDDSKADAEVDLEDHSKISETSGAIRRLSRTFSGLFSGIYKSMSSAECATLPANDSKTASNSPPMQASPKGLQGGSRIVRFMDDMDGFIPVQSTDTVELYGSQNPLKACPNYGSPTRKARRKDPRVLTTTELQPGDPLVVAIGDYVGCKFGRGAVEALVVSRWSRERAQWMLDHFLRDERASIGDFYYGYLTLKYTDMDLHIMLRTQYLRYFLPSHYGFAVRDYLIKNGVADVPDAIPKDHTTVSTAIKLWNAARACFIAEMKTKHMRSALRVSKASAEHANGLADAIQAVHVEHLLHSENLMPFLMHGFSARSLDAPKDESSGPKDFSELITRVRDVLSKQAWSVAELHKSLMIVMDRVADNVMRVFALMSIGQSLRERIHTMNKSLTTRHQALLAKASQSYAKVLSAVFPRMLPLESFQGIVADLKAQEWDEEDAEKLDAACAVIAGMEGQVALYYRIQTSLTEPLDGELRPILKGISVDFLLNF